MRTLKQHKINKVIHYDEYYDIYGEPIWFESYFYEIIVECFMWCIKIFLAFKLWLSFIERCG